MINKLLRFTLDLFDSAAPTALQPLLPAVKKPVQRPKLPTAVKKQPNVPLAVDLTSQLAMKNVAGIRLEGCRLESPVVPLPLLALLPLSPLLPPVLPEPALAPAAFEHPHASRQILLSGVRVAYVFRRAKRRTIGFSVGPDGLAVSAPAWVPLHEVDRAVMEKSGWILKKLYQARECSQRLASTRVNWANGCTFAFLGRTAAVVLDGRHALGVVESVLHPWPDAQGSDLHIGLPHSASAEQIRDATQVWLMRQAKRLFTQRLSHFAPLVGVQWHKLSLSSASTRWGSASADGSIRLNWRLMHFSLAVIDYVVVHELSHLRVMSHSPQFWAVVREVIPDYAELRGQLRRALTPPW